MDEHKPQTLKPLDRYLSVVDVWAMAFGCMVGWGVFAMPGTIDDSDHEDKRRQNLPNIHVPC